MLELEVNLKLFYQLWRFYLDFTSLSVVALIIPILGTLITIFTNSHVRTDTISGVSGEEFQG